MLTDLTLSRSTIFLSDWKWQAEHLNLVIRVDNCTQYLIPETGYLIPAHRSQTHYKMKLYFMD